MRRQRAEQGDLVQKHPMSSGSNRLDSRIACWTVQQAPLATQMNVEWLDRLGRDRPQQNPPKAG